MNAQLLYLNAFLGEQICEAIVSFVHKPEVMHLFDRVTLTEKIYNVHGNMFSGNILFTDSSQLIVIDPISTNHISKHSLSEIDIASFLCDIIIFDGESSYRYVFDAISQKYSKDKKRIINLFLLLKLCVRLRYAYMEIDISNGKDEKKANKIIIERTPNLIKKYLAWLIKQYNDKVSL